MEKALAPHSSTLAWKIPWTEEPGRLQSMGSLRVGYDWATSFHFSFPCIGEGNGNPLQCSCLENPRDGGAWWAALYGVTQSRTRLKRLSSSSSRGNKIVNNLEVLVTQSCPARDCSSPDSSIHGILQARILEWVAIPFSRRSSWPRDWTWVSCIVGRFFTIWATREAQGIQKQARSSQETIV